MEDERRILRILAGTPTRDGAGVKLRRMIGHDDTARFDPFLMLDVFRSKDPKDYLAGFPWHPHRGIETVTFMVSGTVTHGDSLGHSGAIGGGDIQWMTAGSGIIHQEMPQPSEENWGLQLWVNLPAKSKMTAPRYQDIASDRIPVVEEPGCSLRVIAGERGKVTGPVTGIEAEPTFLDITLVPHGLCEIPTDPSSTCFAVVVVGSLLDLRLGPGMDQEIEEPRVVLYGEGRAVVLRASARGARVLLVSGRPLREPVAWGGPIVMNTREELDEAFEELRNGTFLKHG